MTAAEPEPELSLRTSANTSPPTASPATKTPSTIHSSLRCRALSASVGPPPPPPPPGSVASAAAAAREHLRGRPGNRGRLDRRLVAGIFRRNVRGTSTHAPTLSRRARRPCQDAPMLKDKVIVVTGASRGIGKGLATYLARARCIRRVRGAHGREGDGGVPGNDSRDRRRDPRRRWNGDGDSLRHRFRRRHHCARRRRPSNAYGRLDVLVNNAMTPTHAPLDEVDRRHVGRLDARQRAQSLPLHRGGDAGDEGATAAGASSTSRRARPRTR